MSKDGKMAGEHRTRVHTTTPVWTRAKQLDDFWGVGVGKQSDLSRFVFGHKSRRQGAACLDTLRANGKNSSFRVFFCSRLRFSRSRTHVSHKNAVKVSLKKKSGQTFCRGHARKFGYMVLKVMLELAVVFQIRVFRQGWALKFRFRDWVEFTN